MKRLLVFSVIFTILAGAVSAQVTVKGSAGAVFDAFTYVDPDKGDSKSVAGFGRSGEAKSSIGLDIAGATEEGTAGFRAQINFRLGVSGNYDVEAGDWAGIWYKPIPQLRIDAGRFMGDTLRGKIGGPSWNNYGIITGGEDDIFKRFDGRNAVLLGVTPVDGLYIGAMAYSLANLGRAGSDGLAGKPWFGSEEIKYAYQRIQISAGYTIPDIGVVRAQYFGLNPDVASRGYLYDQIKAPYIQAAFALTAVEGLTLDVGGKIPLPLSDPDVPNRTANLWALTATGIKAPTDADPATGTVPVGGTYELKGKYQAPYQGALGAKYVMGDITVAGRLDGKFAGYTETPVGGKTYKMEMGPEIRAYLFPSYKMDTITIQVEGGIIYAGDAKLEGDTYMKGGLAYGFGAFVQKDFTSSAYIRVGLGYAGGETLGTAKDPAKLNGVFSVPVQFNASF